MKKIILLPFLFILSLVANAQVTSLVENFNTCDSNANGQFPNDGSAGWSVYSVSGLQTWRCYGLYGVSGSPCIEVNGYAGGGDNTNEDWLITPQLTLSSYSTIYFNFYSLYKYAGDTLHIMVSNNYVAGYNPDSSVYTWTPLPLNTPFAADTAHSVWFIHTGDLTPFKATPLYIGFKYTSTDTDGSRWNVDSVYTSTTTKVPEISNYNNAGSLQIAVLGDAKSNLINLSYSVNEAGDYKVCVYDMMGREVFTKSIYAQSGIHPLVVNGINLDNGMYIIKITGNNDYGYTKALIH